MAGIRVYQSLFYVPGPTQRNLALGIALHNKADVRPRQPNLDGVVNASGPYYVPPLQRNLVLGGVALHNKADVRPRQPSLDGVFVATGSNGPELWNQPKVAQPTSGWEFQQPALVNTRKQAFDNPSLPSGPAIVSRNFTPVLRGVNIRPRLPSLDGATIAAGSNGPELWNPPAPPATQITTGWEFQQPPLVTRRKPAEQQTDDDAADVIAPITAPPQLGWNAVLPELRRARPAAPSAVLDNLSLPLGGGTDVRGWNVSPAELKQVKPRIGFADASVAPETWGALQTVAPAPWGWNTPPPSRSRPFADLTQALPRLDQPQDQPRGWSVVLPELLPKAHRVLTEFTSRLDFSPTVATGWNVALPDLPQFKRNQALQDQPSGLERAGTIPAAVNWTVEPPITQRRPTVSGALAGAILAPQAVNPVAVGWSIVLPELAPRRKPDLTAVVPRLDKPADLSTGWNVVLPDLPAFRRFEALPEITGRLDPPVTSTGAVFVEGWSIVLPATRVRPRTGGALAGGDLSPTAPQQQPFGWSTTTPDLPAAKRKMSLESAADRIGAPQTLVTGSSIVTPDLRSFRQRAGFLEGFGARSDRAQEQPSGWTINVPDLSRGRRSSTDAIARPERFIAPVAVVTVTSGWVCVLPDLAAHTYGRLAGALAGPVMPLITPQAVPKPSGGVARPSFPWWLPQYVATETARRAARREASARTADVYAVPPAPYGIGRLAYRDPPTATVYAIPPMPIGTGTAQHLIIIAQFNCADTPPANAEEELLFSEAIRAFLSRRDTKNE